MVFLQQAEGQVIMLAQAGCLTWWSLICKPVLQDTLIFSECDDLAKQGPQTHSTDVSNSKIDTLSSFILAWTELYNWATNAENFCLMRWKYPSHG